MKYDRTIIGYHGCDAAVANDLIIGASSFKKSENDYDWLGWGIYFWEYGLDRAMRFAFSEGKAAFPGARIRLESHIQIAVRNPDCILGVFRPMIGSV